jgi:hypothetical protein
VDKNRQLRPRQTNVPIASQTDIDHLHRPIRS